MLTLFAIVPPPDRWRRRKVLVGKSVDVPGLSGVMPRDWKPVPAWALASVVGSAVAAVRVRLVPEAVPGLAELKWPSEPPSKASMTTGAALARPADKKITTRHDATCEWTLR